MADNLPDAMNEAVKLHGLTQGLNLMLDYGEHAANAAYSLAELIEQKANQLANDLERIEAQASKEAAA